MRTLVSVKDILEDANRIEVCPRCSPEEPLHAIQSTINFSKSKGVVNINKVGVCPIHGPVNITRRVKSVRMCGKDAEVIPDFEH
jgi:nitrate/TMAO reductase-like tetraheme cytochrome c subunit